MRRLLAAAAALLLLVPLIVETTPTLVATLRLAASLTSKPWNQRRIIILGPWYADVREIRRIVPANEAIALIPKRPEDRDVAMFSIYHLYPRPARVFWSWPDWQKNAHEGHDRSTPPPSWIVVVNGTKTPPLELTHFVNGEYRKVPLR